MRVPSEDILLRWFLWERALMKAFLSFKPTNQKVEFWRENCYQTQSPAFLILGATHDTPFELAVVPMRLHSRTWLNWVRHVWNKPWQLIFIHLIGLRDFYFLYRSWYTCNARDHFGNHDIPVNLNNCLQAINLIMKKSNEGVCRYERIY